ncbi:BA14K family protein [Rhizobium sp. ARZ01]|uniref:BA14K family protein n=1 Tax=Rhizobium sp. ARZ01 TaxID=2769313 RepID=UPI00177FE750|nr:BA14K family protein [Rhizobium sp. ARZ01]MBD9371940.1 BA14K family protein [Rhizobium sp. ARZ01]
MKKLSVVVLAALTAFSGVLPAGAAPFNVAPMQHASQSADVHDVQYRHDNRRHDRHHYHRPPPRHGWHNGHRGYRDHRHGYRRHSDGWWYPLAAFGAGAIIGGAIASPPRYVSPPPRASYTSRHVEWCASRYRTYRAYDNTYVPQVGYRAECISPYS